MKTELDDRNKHAPAERMKALVMEALELAQQMYQMGQESPSAIPPADEAAYESRMNSIETQVVKAACAWAELPSEDTPSTTDHRLALIAKAERVMRLLAPGATSNKANAGELYLTASFWVTLQLKEGHDLAETMELAEATLLAYNI